MAENFGKVTIQFSDLKGLEYAVTQLLMERDEARDIARKLFPHAVVRLSHVPSWLENKWLWGQIGVWGQIWGGVVESPTCAKCKVVCRVEEMAAHEAECWSE